MMLIQSSVCSHLASCLDNEVKSRPLIRFVLKLFGPLELKLRSSDLSFLFNSYLVLTLVLASTQSILVFVTHSCAEGKLRERPKRIC